MKKIIRLTESDLARIVKRVLMENETDPLPFDPMIECMNGLELGTNCAKLRTIATGILQKYNTSEEEPTQEKIITEIMKEITNWSNAITAAGCAAEEATKASTGDMSTKEKLESCVQENFPDFGQ